MRRRHVLLGAGAAASGSALIGTGAFSRVESQRDVTIEVAEDSDAYLGLDEVEGSANSDNYVNLDEHGRLEIDISNNPNGGGGVNPDSVTWFDSMVEVCNQGTEDAGFYIVPPDDGDFPDETSAEDGDGNDRLQFYTGEAAGSQGSDGTQSVMGEHNAIDISVGECKELGVRTVTKGVDATEEDELFKDEVTLIADVAVEEATDDADSQIIVSETLNGQPGFLTIQDALDGINPQNGATGAEAGDTILVEGGEFDERVEVTEPDITLFGSGPDQTTITGQISATESGFTLRETTVRADPDVAEDTAVLVDDGTDAVVSNNTIIGRDDGVGLKIDQAPSSGTAEIEANTFQPSGNETAQSFLMIGSTLITDGGEQTNFEPQPQVEPSDQPSVQVLENQFVGNVGGQAAVLVDIEDDAEITVEDNDFSETLLFDDDADLISNRSANASLTMSGNTEPEPLSQGEGVEVPGDGIVRTADLTVGSALPELTAQDIAESLIPGREAPEEKEGEGFFMGAYVPTVVDGDTGIPIEASQRGTTDGTTANENAAIAIPESTEQPPVDDVGIPSDFGGTDDISYIATIPVEIVWNSTLNEEEFGKIAFEISGDTGSNAFLVARSFGVEQPQGRKEIEIPIAYKQATTSAANNFRDGGSFELTVDFDAFSSSPSELSELAGTSTLNSTIEYATPNNDLLDVADFVDQASSTYEEGLELAEEVTKLPEGSVEILRESARLALYADIATDDRELAEEELVQGATIDGLSAFAEKAENINKFPDIFDSTDNVAPAGPAVAFETDPGDEPNQQEIQVTNASFTGDNRSGGVFDFNPSSGVVDSVLESLFIANGAILSTGKIEDIEGPNESSSTSTETAGGSDDDLEALPTIEGDTFDAASLEFDLEVPPDITAISFRYVFGSEEYNEFTGSSFNDVFAFFVNGENVATVPDPDDPGGRIPASINNVNHGKDGVEETNPQLFINNDPYDGNLVTVNPEDPPGPGIGFDPSAADQGDEPFPFEMDGFTVPLEITAPVNPGESNDVKIAIADVNDPIYDSWVVVAAGDITAATGSDTS